MMAWLRAEWEVLLLAAMTAVVGLLYFRQTLGVYSHIFFPGRALRNSLIKTLLMLALMLAIFALPLWLAQRLLPDGWSQLLALLLSFVLLDILWGEADRWLDRIIVGR